MKFLCDNMEKPISIQKLFMCLIVVGILTITMGTIHTSNASSYVYVNITGNDSNIGTSAHPYQTISQGINKVSNNGTVKLSKGTYNLNNGSGHTDYGISITKNITIQGAGNTQTIIDAKKLNYIFLINKSNVIIRDLKIENGYSQSGGAITNSIGSNLILINCILTSNIANKTGGAIYNSGKLTITNSTLTNNSIKKGYGADIYNHNGSAEIHFNNIIGNYEKSIYSDSGTVNAQNNWWGTNNNPGTELENFQDINNWTPLWGATIKSITINGDKGIQVSGANGTYSRYNEEC